MISNAVRCAPPGNKPLPVEQALCRVFLAARLAALPRLKVIITLGDVARRSLMKAVGLPASAGASGHGAETLTGGYHVINSYHCCRLNTNTGRLTPAMFQAVFAWATIPMDAIKAASQWLGVQVGTLFLVAVLVSLVGLISGASAQEKNELTGLIGRLSSATRGSRVPAHLERSSPRAPV